jgi:Mg2+ and Co2+ transporter CorA
MTIICRRYDLSTHHTETFDRFQVDSYLKHEQTLLWIEMKCPDDADLDWLGQTCSLHPSLVKLVQSKGDYPSFDWQEEYYVFASTAVRFDEQQVLHYPVYLITSQKYIITIDYQPVGVFVNVRKQWDRSQAIEPVALYFIVLILVSIVVSFFEAVRAIRLQNPAAPIPIKAGGLPQHPGQPLNRCDHYSGTAAVITGFYGINVGGLYPNGNNTDGAWFVLALLVVLAILQFVLLRPLWRRRS